MKRWLGAWAIALAVGAAACGGGAEESGGGGDATPNADAEATPDVDPIYMPAQANRTAPDRFQVRLDTTKGPIVIEVVRDWAPRGADRFYNLVELGYYDDAAFFRVLDGFVVQFGIHADPGVSRVWREAGIQDDPVVQSNTRGTVTFATSGPDTRTTQLFINLGNNANLDQMGFSPFGRVIEGMEAVDALYSGYGEGAPRGQGPDQGRIQSQGNAYLRAEFGELDYIEQARVVEGEAE